MTKTFRERPQRVILQTYDLWDIWSERWGDMTWPTKRQWQRQIQWKRQRQWQLQKHPQRTISEPCDIWDPGYISDNWEQKSEHSQWSLNKWWQGQHSQFLQCFSSLSRIACNSCLNLLGLPSMRKPAVIRTAPTTSTNFGEFFVIWKKKPNEADHFSRLAKPSW